LAPSNPPASVIREKSQSRAQDDSPSLSPAHDGTTFVRTSEPWPPFQWPFSAQRLRPDDFHRERRIASIIITALAAAKMPTNKK
jgi:hypothetical protein